MCTLDLGAGAQNTTCLTQSDITSFNEQTSWGVLVGSPAATQFTGPNLCSVQAGTCPAGTTPTSNPQRLTTSSTWNGNLTSGGVADGNTVAVSQYQPASDYTLGLYGNASYVWDGSSWQLPNSPGVTPYAQTFEGHFRAPDGSVAWDYGETLLSNSQAGGVAQDPMLFAFGQSVSSVGFQISSAVTQAFTATIKVYGSAGLTSGLLATYTATTNEGGGICTDMDNQGGSCAGTSPAPWIGVTNSMLGGVDKIKYVTITTNDTAGLYVGTLYTQLSPAPPMTPEPAAGLFAIGGIGLLAVYGRRRKSTEIQIK